MIRTHRGNHVCSIFSDYTRIEIRNHSPHHITPSPKWKVNMKHGCAVSAGSCYELVYEYALANQPLVATAVLESELHEDWRETTEVPARWTHRSPPNGPFLVPKPQH